MTYKHVCAECGKSLSDLNIRHGWITIDTGYRHKPARVHTLCRSRFEDRDLPTQQARSEQAWA